MNGCVSSACETSSVVDTSGAVTRGGAEVPLVAVCDVLTSFLSAKRRRVSHDSQRSHGTHVKRSRQAQQPSLAVLSP